VLPVFLWVNAPGGNGTPSLFDVVAAPNGPRFRPWDPPWPSRVSITSAASPTGRANGGTWSHAPGEGPISDGAGVVAGARVWERGWIGEGGPDAFGLRLRFGQPLDAIASEFHVARELQ